jgi:prolyl oligopeptidase
MRTPHIVLATLALCLDPAVGLGADYPHARRGDVLDVFHGVPVSDPYRWMEDLASPELATWIAAQNARSGPPLEADPVYASSLARMTSLADLYPTSEPELLAGAHAFHREYVGKAIHLFVRSTDGGSTRVLLDDAVLGPGKVLRSFVPSPDGRHVAYVVSEAGADWGEIRIHDVDGNRGLPDILQNVRFEGPLDWTADGRGLLYRRFAPPRDGKREAPAEDPAIYLHRLGDAPARDLRLFAPPADMHDWSLAFGLHDAGRKLFLYVERGPWNDGNIGGSRAQVRVLALDAAGRPAQGAAARVLTPADAAYRIVHADGDRAWLYTDLGAPRRRVVQMDLARPAPANWRTLVPEGEGVLSQASWFGGRLVTHSLENVHSVVRVFDAAGQRLREIPLPGTGVVQNFWGTATSPRMSLLYSGLLQAPVMLGHDLERGTTQVDASAKGAPDLGAYDVVQEWFVSKDGTRVPMFVAARKGLVRDGSHPALVYGYGASGTSMLPVFREDLVAWLEMGGVYVLPNLRGGGEFGADWYKAATRENKQRTFDDLIAASEHLIATGWTSPKRLAISGGSNGGLLVTATMLQRPDLFLAVLADVPVTDALRRYLSGNGRQQVEQWGTPEDADVFPALRAYSPVHNVKPGACYPATLVTTSHDDQRMPAWHAYKFTAALQAAQRCDAPIALFSRASGGHSGGDVNAWMALVAQQYAFLAQQMDGAIKAR